MSGQQMSVPGNQKNNIINMSFIWKDRSKYFNRDLHKVKVVASGKRNSRSNIERLQVYLIKGLSYYFFILILSVYLEDPLGGTWWLFRSQWTARLKTKKWHQMNLKGYKTPAWYSTGQESNTSSLGGADCISKIPLALTVHSSSAGKVTCSSWLQGQACLKTGRASTYFNSITSGAASSLVILESRGNLLIWGPF